MSTEELEAEVLKLAPGDRARLAERLLRSLDSDEENAKLWVEEAERRDRAWDANPTIGRSAADLFRGTRARLKCGNARTRTSRTSASSGSAKSTCIGMICGMICGMNTPPGSLSEAFRSLRSAICSVTRRFSRPSVTTTRNSKLYKPPSSGWKEARHSTRQMSPTEFQVFFKFQTISALPTTLTPRQEPSQLTECLLVGIW